MSEQFRLFSWGKSLSKAPYLLPQEVSPVWWDGCACIYCCRRTVITLRADNGGESPVLEYFCRFLPLFARATSQGASSDVTNRDARARHWPPWPPWRARALLHLLCEVAPHIRYIQWASSVAACSFSFFPFFSFLFVYIHIFCILFVYMYHIYILYLCLQFFFQEIDLLCKWVHIYIYIYVLYFYIYLFD